MSGHNHDHDHHHHDGECHCKECEDKKGDAERTSIEEAGGVAVGLKGHIHGFNADAAARFSGALLTTGKWVEKEAGSLLGHIKAAVYTADGSGITFNLTDVEAGVEQHGTLPPQHKVDFSFMSAVLDVDPEELEHIMMHAMEDTGLDYHLEGGHDHHHCHDHEHEHHGHRHNDEREVCHCDACEDRRKKETEKKGSFWDKLRRSKK